MRKRLPDIFFILTAVIICIYVIFVPPARGVADQGDFERVMIPAGLDFLDRASHNFYEFVEPVYKLSFMYKGNAYAYPFYLLGIIPATSYIYPITIAKILCIGLGHFDTRVLAGVMSILYAAVCAGIVRRLRVKSNIARSLLYGLFLLIFFNGINLTIFNSLYGQSMMLVAMAMFILACMILVENWGAIKIGHLFFLCAACVFLLGAKLQCFVFLPVLCILWLYLIRHVSYKKTAVFFLCFTVWYGAGNYLLNGHGLNEDTQYNSVFYGILADSKDPEADLAALGLDTDLAADAGKHAYLAPEQYVYPPRTPVLQEKFYDKMSNAKLVKFYLTHPDRLLRAMEVTANHAFQNKITLGTFEKEAGKPEGACEYRFALWETVRSSLPRTLWFIVPVYGLFFIGGVYEAIRHKNKYAYLFLMILIMGFTQFPMPYLGNGRADITKQLFIFNLVFDIGVFVSVYFTGKKIGLWIKGRGEKRDGIK